MNQILKRLELIKTSIALEDEEIIQLQVTKLQTLEIDNEVQAILNLIRHNDYKEVLYHIESYLKHFSGVTIYEDPKTQGLKLELKVLEQKLQELSDKKSDYYNNLNAFYIEYNLQLGKLIQEVLRLNQLRLKKEYEDKQKVKDAYEALQKEKEALAEEMKHADFASFEEFMKKMHKLQDDYTKNRDEFNEFDRVKNAYNEAKNDYEEFSNEYAEQLKDVPQELSKEEKKELKESYKKACKMCHPDIVIEALKDDAQVMMQELNAAYAKNDLQGVKEILKRLETGEGFIATSDSVDDNKILVTKTALLRNKIKKVQDEIKEIQEDENYEMMSNPELWSAYFDEQRKELTSQIERLKESIQPDDNEDYESKK